jgi:hypothetical protein
MRSLFNSTFAATAGNFFPVGIEFHGEGEIVTMTKRSIYNALTGILLRLMAL